MATKMQSSGFGFAQDDFDWNTYESYRPNYPPGVLQRLFDFHDKHAGGYSAVADVGCGSGVSSGQLLARFDTLTLADPNAHNLAEAMSRLQSVATQADKTLLSHNASAENLPISDGSQDLVTCFTAIHFTDTMAAAREAARVLKPGGTYAVVSYYGRPRLDIAPAEGP